MIPRLLPLALLAFLTGACDGKDDTAADPADADADADADTDTDADGDVDPAGALSGTLLFGDDSPAAGAEAQLCLSTCRSTKVGADGSFTFASLATGRYSLHFLAQDGVFPCAEALNAVDVQDGLTTTLPLPVYALPWEDDTSIDASTDEAIDAGEYLTLEVDGSTLTAPFGVDLAIQGVRVPPEFRPDLSSLGEVEVLDLWYLGAFDTAADPPVPFYVYHEYDGVYDDDKVGIRVAGYIEADWLDGGTATSVGGTLVSDPGSGLPYLTTLALVRLD